MNQTHKNQKKKDYDGKIKERKKIMMGKSKKEKRIILKRKID